MTTTVARAFALLCWVFVASGAATARADDTAWIHKGSLMKLVHTGNEVMIKYLHPRPSLHKDGIQRGTVLFQGTLQEDKSLKGSVFSFREGCDPVSYDATGRFDPRSLLENFEIEGVGPQWAEKGCESKPADSAASPTKLVFTPYGMEEEEVESDKPVVASGDQASVELTAASSTMTFPREAVTQGGAVREGPAMKSTLVDTLNQGDKITIIEDTGQSMNGFNWYKIKYQGGKGYHWGGLICVQGEAIPGVLSNCR
jgi:hypothetical protein